MRTTLNKKSYSSSLLVMTTVKWREGGRERGRGREKERVSERKIERKRERERDQSDPAIPTINILIH